jgi:hypothetical protein
MVTARIAKPEPASRLVLQDPQAAVEAQLPALRLSTELAPAQQPALLKRDEAADMRDALLLKPEDVIREHAQLKKITDELQASQREATALRCL